MKMRKRFDFYPLLSVAIVLAVTALLFAPDIIHGGQGQTAPATEIAVDDTVPLSVPAYDFFQIPEYSGLPAIPVKGNCPTFSADELHVDSFEMYGDLDRLGRCTTALACCGPETLPPPNDRRGDISSVAPTGFVQGQYECIEHDDTASGPGWLYNRCHLIAWSISDEDDNPLNLITGTRYMNVAGMWPYEEQILNHIREKKGHVLYRVTPDFRENELVCRGVLLEAESVEDNGAALCFCVYCYNVQPGVSINYADGSSEYSGVFLDTESPSVISPQSIIQNSILKRSRGE